MVPERATSSSTPRKASNDPFESTFLATLQNELQSLDSGVQCLGLRVYGLWFMVESVGCMGSGFMGFGVQGLGLRVKGSWLRVQSVGCRGQGLWFEIWDGGLGLGVHDRHVLGVRIEFAPVHPE